MAPDRRLLALLAFAVLPEHAAGQMCRPGLAAGRAHLIEGPFDTTFADVDGDGSKDLVVAANGLFTMLNDGDGFFGPATFAAATSGTLESADFDRNGTADLAVVTYANVWVLLGDGAGGFQPPTMVFGLEGNFIALGDLDGAGAIDIVGLTYDAIEIAFGDGNGTFQAPVPYRFGAQASFRGVAVADVTGDGALDIVATDDRNDLLWHLPNLGTGAFGTPQSLAVEGVFRLAVGSFNGDAYADVAAGLRPLQGTPGLVVVEGSPGGFGSASVYPMAAAPWHIDGGDMNADGATDLVVTDVRGRVGVLACDGAGSFREVDGVGAITYAGTSLGDVNGDGLDDVLITSYGAGSITVLHSSADDWLDAALRFDVGPLARSSATADFDGDGHTDVAVSTYGSVAVLLNDGAGGFARSATLAAGPAARALSAADWDGDGRVDLAVANVYGDDLSVFLGNGDGTFRQLANVAAGRTPWAMASGDVDGNGTPDLAVIDGYDRATILLGYGNGTFRAAPALAVGSQAEDLALRDVNGDGTRDLLVARGSANDVAVLLGNGNGSFQPPVGYPVGQYAAAIVTGDWDGSGSLDLAVSCSTDETIAVLLGTGSGTFVAAPPIPADDAASLATGDFDADGLADLAVVHAGRSALSVLHGTGTGSFAIGATYESGTAPTSLTAADFDGDGATDIAATDAGADQLVVLLSRTLLIAPPTLPAGLAGVPYSQTLTARLGAPPYDFAVSGGALPLGLGLAASGVLDGIPSSAGTFDFTVDVRDSRGCAEARSYALTIGGGVAARNLLTGAGLGPPNPNRVRAYREDGSPTAVDFAAYGAGQWGVNVAAGDASGAGADQIVTAPGPGATYGPQVRAFLRDGSPLAKVNYYAYGTLRYGANVAAGDADADGLSEILTGAGPGAVFGPHVRGFDYDGTAVVPMAAVNYFAYATLKYGVNAAAGDVDADGFAELLTAPGPSPAFAPQVRGWNYDGASVSPIGTLNFLPFTSPGYGANVALGDVEADGHDEIACTPGPGPAHPPRFVGFDHDGATVAALPGCDVTTSASRGYGGRIGAGDVSGDGRSDLVTAYGRDPAAGSAVRPFLYLGSVLTPLHAFEAYPGLRYGVNAAGADLRY